jgi:hypothetical protein
MAETRGGPPMQRIGASMAAMMVVLGSHVAMAEDPPPAAMPMPHVGAALDVVDRFLTLPCKHWVVKEVNKDGYNIFQCGNNLAYFSVANSANVVKVVNTEGDALIEFSPYAPSLSFPLELGKKWEGKYKGYTAEDGVRWSGDSHCEVKAYETVAVPAGKLPAYRIDCEDQAQVNGFTIFVHTKSWYSPQAGTVVKVDNQENSKWNMEAAGFAAK